MTAILPLLFIGFGAICLIFPERLQNLYEASPLGRRFGWRHRETAILHRRVYGFLFVLFGIGAYLFWR